MKDLVATVIGIMAGIFAPYYLARFMCIIDNSSATCDDPVTVQWIYGFLCSILLAFACAAFVAIMQGVLEYFKK